MVPISPQVFSGGAVVFDTRSLFDYQQKLAERRAKRDAAEQEALDNYLKELGKTPDPYGMRKNDIPTFNKKLNDFRQLSNDFRKAPKDLESRLKLQQAADDLKIFVARSKEEKEKDKSYDNLIADLAANSEKRKTTNIEKLIADKTNQDLPLDFPGVAMLGIPARVDKEFNPNYYIPKPFDFQKNFDESAKGPGITISELSVGPSKTPGYDEIKKGFGESAIKSIASNFAKNVEADDEKESHYRVKIKNLAPEKLAEQNIRLKKYFPKMEVDDDNPVSLAMAEAIEEAERRTSTDLRAIPKGSTFNFGDKGAQTTRNLYDSVKRLSDAAAAKGKGAALSQVPSADAQTRLLDIAKKVKSKPDFSQADIFLKTEPNGRLAIYEVTERDEAGGAIGEGLKIATITKEDLDLPFQPGVQEERAKIIESKKEKPVPVKKVTTNKWDKYKINR